VAKATGIQVSTVRGYLRGRRAPQLQAPNPLIGLLIACGLRSSGRQARQGLAATSRSGRPAIWNRPHLETETAASGSRSPAILVDQFEEVFTTCTNCAAIPAPHPRPAAQSDRGGPMAKEDIRRAIVNSAVRAILELENSRVDLTLRDLAAQARRDRRTVGAENLIPVM
jgi:hypothetical protein